MDQPFHSGWALKDLWIFAGKPHFWFLGSNPSLLLCIGTGSSSKAVTILVWLASWGNCPRQGTVASTVAGSGMLICLRAVFWVLPFPWPRNSPPSPHRGLDYGLFLPVLSQSLPQPLGVLPDSVPGKPWTVVPRAPPNQWRWAGRQMRVGRDQGRQICLWSGLSPYLPAFPRGRPSELRKLAFFMYRRKQGAQLYLLPSAVSDRLSFFFLSPTLSRSCHGSHAAIHVTLQ